MIEGDGPVLPHLAQEVAYLVIPLLGAKVGGEGRADGLVNLGTSGWAALPNEVGDERHAVLFALPAFLDVGGLDARGLGDRGGDAQVGLTTLHKALAAQTT